MSRKVSLENGDNFYETLGPPPSYESILQEERYNSLKFLQESLNRSSGKRHGESGSLDNKNYNNQKIQLRFLIPLLSENFDCSVSDAILLINAIEDSGSMSNSNLNDQINRLESERQSQSRQISSLKREIEKLTSRYFGEENLRKALQEEIRQYKDAEAMRSENLRRRFYSAESQREKLKLEKKQLEMEIERLKKLLGARR